MEDIKQDSVIAFDTLFTNNHIRMLKILLPFLDNSMQKNIAIYIKYQELQYVFQYFNPANRKSQLSACFHKESANFDINTICDEILPYCNDQEKKQLNQIKNFMQTIKNFQDMMEMMETMKELFPEGMNGEGGFNPEVLSGLGSMFGGGNIDPGQMADLFQAFQGNS